ncbi:MAG: winged helix-turn-helix transcriptional regulator [Candidatus Altiarchaeota archaeon]|nr:winged helix-turn-helix transcriptional regulator [Candidatus Altiarchaeota archaeon]
MDSVRIFSALGDETRLRIVLFLRDKERCACEIPPAVGRAQPTVSQHLKVLKEARILKSRRDGTKIMYSVCCPEVLRLIDFSKNIKTCK